MRALTTSFLLSAAKTRQNTMAQQKTPRNTRVDGRHSNVKQSQSLLNVNELETRAKATVKDIDELYAALQGLVPKKSHGNGGLRASQRKPARSGNSGTETDRSAEDWDQPSTTFRRCYSEKYPKKQWTTDNNMNFVTTKPSPKKPGLLNTVPVNPVLDTLLDERLFASDTEAELNHLEIKEPQKLQLQRHFSLPTYEEEHGKESAGNQKRSKFSIFNRQGQSKPAKKKSSSWRSFFSTLSLKRKITKKHAKNKVEQTNSANTIQNGSIKMPKRQTPKSTRRPSIDARRRNSGINSSFRKSGRKRLAPAPPASSGNTTLNDQVETPDPQPRDRTNALDTKTDLVQKKLSAWYKLAMKETYKSTPKEPLRMTRSHENLLTDTEIIRKRGAFSSDTDSYSGGDRNRNNVVPKTRVRKTRARRNRRRERARFHSCPNVKLVTKALDDAERKANTQKLTTDTNNTKNDEHTDGGVQGTNHITTVKPVEAKISFGSSMDNEEPVADFMKLQNANARNWLTRQCSKTTISCIRPLQLNLLYSESPSRETVHRARSTVRRPKADAKESGAGDPQEFAFRIRRSSSRRRKRRSFKRGQTRLPHQSPFYVPSNALNTATKAEKELFNKSKDSGLGSPDLDDDKRFATFPVMKRDQRFAKLHSESEDSGWASGQRHFTSTSETGIQTEPVVVMTTVARIRRTVLPHMLTAYSGQSDA